MKNTKNTDIQEFMSNSCNRIDNIRRTLEFLRILFEEYDEEEYHVQWISLLDIVSEYANITYKRYYNFGLDNGYLE